MRRAAAIVPIVAAAWASAQRRRVRTIPRLPEAAADLDVTVLPIDGASSDRRPEATCTLVLLGDSLISGVGVETADEALPVQLGRRVASELGAPLRVRVIARTGARLDDVADTQVPLLAQLAGPVDAVVVSAGANDATHLTAPGGHDAAVRRVVAGIRDARGEVPVVLCGLPDFRGSRALSPLLRRALHGYGTHLHRRQARLADELGVWFVPRDPAVCDAFARDRALLASDRFHASSAGAALLAGTATHVVAGALRSSAPAPPPRASYLDGAPGRGRSLALRARRMR